MFNQQKCWLKVLKCLWTSLIFIHASAKIYVSIWAPTVHCEIDFFLHTYASSKKKLYTVRKLSPKLSWICIFSQTFIVVNVFSRLHKIYLKRIKKNISILKGKQIPVPTKHQIQTTKIFTCWIKRKLHKLPKLRKWLIYFLFFIFLVFKSDKLNKKKKDVKIVVVWILRLWKLYMYLCFNLTSDHSCPEPDIATRILKKK